MQETNNEQFFDKWFKKEVQFIVWIITLVIAVVVPLFTYKMNIGKNTYEIKSVNAKIEEIKLDRKESWIEYDKYISKTNECLENIKNSVADVKSQVNLIDQKVDYIKENL